MPNGVEERSVRTQGRLKSDIWCGNCPRDLRNKYTYTFGYTVVNLILDNFADLHYQILIFSSHRIHISQQGPLL